MPLFKIKTSKKHRNNIYLLVLFLNACSLETVPESTSHITQQHRDITTHDQTIPAPITQPNFLPPPPQLDAPELDLYTIVVNDLPVREILFTLARDAGLNVDIAESITGNITINAIDQPLGTLLDRISRLAGLRYTQTRDSLIIVSDQPFLKTYDIDYINITRKTESTVQVETQIASAGGGSVSSATGNSSSSLLTNQSENSFWQRLISNVSAILDETGTSTTTDNSSSTVIPNPEAGLLTVRGTTTQHQHIKTYLSSLLTNAKRQVLVEATIVEIQLSTSYQTGVDWSILARSVPGFSFSQVTTSASLASGAGGVLSYLNQSSDLGNISAAISALETFGDVKVLSSPKLMMLNNQTSILKVVDDRVYFTFDVEREEEDNGDETVTVESTIHTVPIGLVMIVTPQISQSDVVTLNVRPSITRILRFVEDPNPELRGSGDSTTTIPNLIPEVQIREIESVLSVASGHTAVLGGLMQDGVQKNESNVPLLSKVPLIGKLFGARDDSSSKSELLIFLKPTVLTDTSSDNSKLAELKKYLPELRPSTPKTSDRPTNQTHTPP